MTPFTQYVTFLVAFNVAVRASTAPLKPLKQDEPLVLSPDIRCITTDSSATCGEFARSADVLARLDVGVISQRAIHSCRFQEP